jgi:hypothetical protein
MLRSTTDNIRDYEKKGEKQDVLLLLFFPVVVMMVCLRNDMQYGSKGLIVQHGHWLNV